MSSFGKLKFYFWGFELVEVVKEPIINIFIGINGSGSYIFITDFDFLNFIWDDLVLLMGAFTWKLLNFDILELFRYLEGWWNQ